MHIFQSLIQGDFGVGHGNFEAVLHEGTTLMHWWRDNSPAAGGWARGQKIADGVTGPGSIIQSDFGSSEHGNFEVVVPIGDQLWHYWHDNSNVTKPWARGQKIADGVTGPGSIIQSDFGSSEHGNFEVVARVGGTLMHFWHDNSDVSKPWARGQKIADGVTGPGSIIQSDFGSGEHGNFEVVARVGGTLMHFWHDNSDVSKPWARGQFITDSAWGAASLIQSDYDSGSGHGNFEVLVDECTESVVGYWHSNKDVTLPWLRQRVLLGEPTPTLVTSRKIVQLTGPASFNAAEFQRKSLRGMDLGSSFEHEGRIYFLFGDTWRVNQDPLDENLDSIAYTMDSSAVNGLTLTYVDGPVGQRPPHFPAISQRGFEVPLDGVSWDGTMFVFFSTDHYQVDATDQMGRSVWGSSTDGGATFVSARELSRSRYVNVSVERGRLDAATAAVVGFASGTEVLWIWGSGRYRSSDVYLCVMPLTALTGKRQIRYFAGQSGSLAWSDHEDDAAALFPSGSVGELSVRWNPFLQRYLALFNADNPPGIMLHHAPTPWGPWSQQPIAVFDAWASGGYGKFMHIACDGPTDPKCDGLADNMFPGDGSYPTRYREWAGAYGPYQIAARATGSAGARTDIYFVLSTWNPYETVLMTTAISVEDLMP